MSSQSAIVITTNETPATLTPLDGRTFQVHVLPGTTMLRLYPVTLPEPDTRCPVVIGGERCGELAGHGGKHCWAGGD